MTPDMGAKTADEHPEFNKTPKANTTIARLLLIGSS
jgi:hypothetical protein